MNCYSSTHFSCDNSGIHSHETHDEMAKIKVCMQTCPEFAPSSSSINFDLLQFSQFLPLFPVIFHTLFPNQQLDIACHNTAGVATNHDTTFLTSTMCFTILQYALYLLYTTVAVVNWLTE